MLPSLYKSNVAVIGLGYVGLPLACQIAKAKVNFRTNQKLYLNVIGFDICQKNSFF